MTSSFPTTSKGAGTLVTALLRIPSTKKSAPRRRGCQKRADRWGDEHSGPVMSQMHQWHETHQGKILSSYLPEQRPAKAQQKRRIINQFGSHLFKHLLSFPRAQTNAATALRGVFMHRANINFLCPTASEGRGRRVHKSILGVPVAVQCSGKRGHIYLGSGLPSQIFLAFPKLR